MADDNLVQAVKEIGSELKVFNKTTDEIRKCIERLVKVTDESQISEELVKPLEVRYKEELSPVRVEKLVVKVENTYATDKYDLDKNDPGKKVTRRVEVVVDGAVVKPPAKQKAPAAGTTSELEFVVEKFWPKEKREQKKNVTRFVTVSVTDPDEKVTTLSRMFTVGTGPDDDDDGE